MTDHYLKNSENEGIEMIDTNDPGIRKAAEFVTERMAIKPLIGVILGSGLGAFAGEIESQVIIPTNTIPDYPESTVEGHAGKLVTGILGQVPVLAFQGRVHYYEGYPIHKVVIPVRLMAAIGVKYMVITNASGGVSKDLEPGDLMLITDHINLMGTNPLIGQQWGFERFPDMSNAYDKELQEIARNSSMDLGIDLKEGVLGAWSGPTYETVSEVRFLETVGVSAACMSTVPEVIAAARLHLRTVGISCITNMATGISPSPLTHDEVTETAAVAQDQFVALLRKIIGEIGSISDDAQ